MKNRIAILSLIVGSLLFAVIAEGKSTHIKLSPYLEMMTSSNLDSVATAKRHVHLKTSPEYTEPMADTLVLFQGNPEVLEAYGARVRSVLGNVATVDIPISALRAVANHPNVVQVEEARKVRPRLDVSVPASGANSVWGSSTRPLPPPWAGNTGRNVVVGIVDSGIDLKHADFKDSLGRSRILYLLDQTTGKECTKQQIDAGSCAEDIADGHGTHALGIAAGNGSATTGSQPAYRYIGMAPEANLIVVKTDFLSTHVIDGINYIEAKAASLGLPVVINLSLGYHFGPHDGTSVFETAMDNASGTGQVIVAAAGNEALDQIHASGTIAEGANETVSFSVPVGSSTVLLDLWYPGPAGNQIGVKVTSPSGGTTCVIPSSGFLYPSDTNPVIVSNTICGTVMIATPGIDSVNGDHEIIIELQNVRKIKVGTWMLTLTGGGCGALPCVTNGAFDVWVDDNSSGSFFVDHFDPTKTVDMPGTATKVIAVGAYTTKTSWTSSKGPGTDPFGTVGDATFFSSIGPRRSCSNTGNPSCTAVVQKPELTAPGEEIMSTYAARTTTAGVCFDITSFPNPSNRCLDPDVRHIIFQGTSMSAPHVTGAVALMLAQNASLTSDLVKTALTDHTLVDSSTGSTPNNTWGYGKLAIDKAIASVGSSPPPGHGPPAPTGVKAVPGPGSKSATLSWSAITNDIYLDGYNVYLATVGGGPYALVNSSLVTATSLKVQGLTVGTKYYFVVTSVDTPGIESAPSAEVNATPVASPSSSSGGGCGMIDLSQSGPSNPAEAISYLLSMFLPLVLIRLLRRRHDRGSIDLIPRTDSP